MFAASVPVRRPIPIDVVETRRPFSFVARSALVREVSQVDPELVNCVVLARVLLNSPTTVEEACEINPEVNVARLETPSVLESVAAPVTPSVPAKEPFPPVNVPIVPAFVKRFVELAVVLKNEVEVACVNVTFPLKVFVPVHVFVSERSVDDAAVTVIVEPLAKFVPLIVPSDPEMSPEPIVVVEITRPFSSVERSAEVSDVICKFVVVAFTARVEEAMSCTPLSHKEVVVDCTAAPA